MPVTLICEQCSTPFQVDPYLKDKARFCSRACKHASMRLAEETKACENCGTLFVLNRFGKQRGEHKYCSRQCSIIAASPKRNGMGIRTFWDKVQQCGHEWLCPFCCWPFQGQITSNGYGLVHSGNKKLRMANRVAWELGNNRSMPDELFAAHYCHFPACCNPMHIHAATQKENMADSVRDLRHYYGQRHHQAKLTLETIKEAFLLRQQGWGFRRLAKHFNVSYIVMYKLINRETWKSIDVDALLRSP